MRCFLSLAAAAGLLLAFSYASDDVEQPLEEEEGEARVLPSLLFPFFRQYQDIDVGANLNRLKGTNSAAFFLIRDGITYIADFVFWWTLHAFFWDGQIARDGDAPLAIQVFTELFNRGMQIQRDVHKDLFGRDPFKPAVTTKLDDAAFESVLERIELRKAGNSTLVDEEENEVDVDGDDKDASPEQRIGDTIQEASFNGLFNFFADPNPNFRNLVMNTGFSFFQLVLWMAPTFLWPGEPLPTPPPPTSRLGEDAGPQLPFIQDRLGAAPLVSELGNSSAAAVYNRLLCPQCVFQNLMIFFLLFAGKIVWWWWFSTVPNFNSFTLQPILGLSPDDNDAIEFPDVETLAGKAEEEEEEDDASSDPLRVRVDGGTVGAALAGTIFGAAAAAAASMSGGDKGGADRPRRRGRRLEREARPLRITPGDIFDGMMTDFLALAEIRAALVRKGLIDEL